MQGMQSIPARRQRVPSLASLFAHVAGAPATSASYGLQETIAKHRGLDINYLILLRFHKQ
jgi:hypothetical protein